jgi:phage I-like protein
MPTIVGMKRKAALSLAIAPLALSLTGECAAPNEIQLLPAGEFRSQDGRPKDAPIWRMNAELAAPLIATCAARKTPTVIDYDHQTLLAKENGKPAPAAGWYRALEWREGQGLYATGVQWTAAASVMIERDEYKFISPVIAYDKAGNINALFMASLTNFPALDGMDEVMLAAASALFTQPPEEEPMDELLEQLRWMLNMPVGATPADIKAQLQKLIDQLGGSTAAASFDLLANVTAMQTQTASLQAQLSAKTGTPPAEQFVPMAQFVALQNELATLTGKHQAEAHAKLLQEALSDGRILPHQQAYWAAQPLSVLEAFTTQAKPMAALAGTQTGGASPAGGTGGIAALSAVEQSICNAMGLSPEAYLKTKEAQ